MFRRMSEYFEYARKPLAASGRSSPAARDATQEPKRCISFLNPEKCSIVRVWRSPMTISASWRRIGCTSSAICACGYWLSPSVFTTMSAPWSNA